MGNRRYVGDAIDPKASAVESTHSGLTSWARALDVDIQVLESELLDLLAYSLGGNLRGKRCTFA
jgi:hypothetical protein